MALQAASSAPPTYSYLIIGAGIFGVSTAYHIIKKFPTADITIIDRDAYDANSRVAASWDWNKVVRADYDDIVYCQLGIEAQDVFKSEELWKPYFHETGIYWICRSNYARDVIANYEKLGRKADLKAVPVSEARKLYNGLFEDADYSNGVQEVLVNKTSGWVAAGDCLRAVTKECLRLGVKYVVGEVGSLLLESDEEGGQRCYGVKTTDGRRAIASHVVVAAGAYTPKLLEYSAHTTGIHALRAGDRIVAGGITTGMTKLDDASYPRFKDMPVGVQGYTAKDGASFDAGS
jgi:glycine/D-amino acid oxidase-like deaminating enzyme